MNVRGGSKASLLLRKLSPLASSDRTVNLNFVLVTEQGGLHVGTRIQVD